MGPSGCIEFSLETLGHKKWNGHCFWFHKKASPAAKQTSLLIDMDLTTYLHLQFTTPNDEFVQVCVSCFVRFVEVYMGVSENQ